VSTPEDYFKIVDDPTKDIKDFRIVNDDVVQIMWGSKEGYEEDSIVASEIHASFVTSYARLRLYELLELLQDRILYFDTDSIFFTWKQGQTMPKLGDYLGDLTDEVGGMDYIIEFVTGGPKQYAYITKDGKRVLKLRGFTLNHRNSEVLHFDSLKDYICNLRPFRCTTLSNPSKIVRLPAEGKIISKQECKSYSPVYTKRIIVEGFKTVPFGWKH
jgi:hypothetical protein